MARIRTIKPEFPHSESLGRVSRDARLLFVMLWTICDDEGRARANSRMLSSLLFPYDDDATQHIPEWLIELERENCIRVYAIDGNAYVHVTNWTVHQKIDKPSKSRLPAPPEKKNRRERPAVIREHSRDSHEASSGDLVPRTKDLGPEGKESSAPPSVAPPPEPPASKPPSPTKGRRWDVNEEVPENWRFEAASARIEHNLPPIDVNLEATKFANYWIAKTGRGSTHADWKRTWLNWALNANANKTNGKGISAHDKGTLGLVQFVANAERSADATDSGDGAGTARNPLPTNGHGPAQMADDGRRFLVRLPALDGSGAPGSVPRLPHKP